MSRIHAHRLIEAASVVEHLLPIGNTPTRESQVRPLTKLEPEQQRQAWEIATSIMPNPRPAGPFAGGGRLPERGKGGSKED
jgi:hypothetical protein